ncbi:hypothetical protein BV20DRAFT_905119, partial [Pilatotrama ljubarskyi]
HPYLYARVLSIFHVNAYIAHSNDEEPRTIQVLWVRWLNVDTKAAWGSSACHLPRLEFAGLDNDAFGFISPDQVLRAAHIIPAFAHGKSDVDLPGYSIARLDEDEDEDYHYYYVGIFVDRDMFMRYLGGGIGHQ